MGWGGMVLKPTSWPVTVYQESLPMICQIGSVHLFFYEHLYNAISEEIS